MGREKNMEDYTYQNLKDALKTAEKNKDEWNQPKYLSLLGEYNLNTGEIKESIKNLDEAYSKYKKLGYIRGTIENLMKLGEAYKRAEDYKRSMKYLEQADVYLKKVGDVHGEAECMMKMAIDNIFMEEYDHALEFATNSQDIYATLSNQIGQANVYYYMALAYQMKENYDEAELWLQNCLDIANQNNEFMLQSMANNSLGIIHFRQGHYNEAFQFFGKALEVDSQEDNAIFKAIDLNNMAATYQVQGEYLTAYNAFNEALSFVIEEQNDEIYEKIKLNIKESSRKKWGDKRIEKLQIIEHPRVTSNYLVKRIRDLIDDGYALYEEGNMQGALRNYSEAVEGIAPLGDCPDKVELLMNVGKVYKEQAVYKKSMQWLNQARKLKTNTYHKADIYGELAEIYDILKDKKSAVSGYTQQMKIAEAFGNLPQKAKAMINIAVVNKKLKQYDRSIELLELSLDIYDQIGHSAEKKQVYEHLAEIYANMGQHKKSLKYKMEARDL
ncbi:MAG: tetratricopeptide repeat protein [Candidatus Lokiarchaeota archaeon]|nr:tetratricopeptide repeat protein [Candidatus Lokiarchaeota archaeon]